MTFCDIEDFPRDPLEKGKVRRIVTFTDPKILRSNRPFGDLIDFLHLKEQTYGFLSDVSFDDVFSFPEVAVSFSVLIGFWQRKDELATETHHHDFERRLEQTFNFFRLPYHNARGAVSDRFLEAWGYKALGEENLTYLSYLEKCCSAVFRILLSGDSVSGQETLRKTRDQLNRKIRSLVKGDGCCCVS